MSTRGTDFDSSKAAIGILNVTVVWARNLMNNHHICKPSPYVKLNLTNNDELPSKRTSMRKHKLNPEWNEVFKIIVTNLHAQSLEINVLDWEQSDKNQNLGKNLVPLKELIPEEPTIVILDLLNGAKEEKNGGQITLNLIYKPFENGIPIELAQEKTVSEKPRSMPDGGGSLVVIIHEARNLEGKHHTNPYVDIIFRGEERKTEVIKKNHNPKWDHEFEFLCDDASINDKMRVQVFSKPPNKGLIYNKESLGFVDISLGSLVTSKTKSTKEMYQLCDSKINAHIQIEMHWRPY